MNENEEVKSDGAVSETPVPTPSNQVTQPAGSVSTARSSLLKDLSVPISIVIAGAFIGAGFFFSQNSGPTTGTAPTNPVAQQEGSTEEVAPVTEADHIKGSVDAPIKIVEYSDFECPFCKQFHSTLNTVTEKYDGDTVAWVFRQFPLEQLHPVKAMAAAMASECVAELGGNDAFWTFTDGYFEKTLTNNRTDIETLIPQLVTQTGVDQAAFTECFESDRHADAINADIQNAVDTGGRGTPWSVVIGPDGSTYPINGALPEAAVTQMIDSLLEQAG